MSLLVKLVANHSGREIDFTDPEYSILAAGTALSHPTTNFMFSRTFDGQRTTVTGASVEAREAQLDVLIQGDDVPDLQSLLDGIDRTLDDVSRWGGTLYYRSETGDYVTRYRVSTTKRAPLSQLDYEVFNRARFTIGLVIDPYGLMDTYDVTDKFSTDTFGTGGLYNLGGSDWTSLLGGSFPVSGGTLNMPAAVGTRWAVHSGTTHTYGDVQATAKLTRSAYATGETNGVTVKYIDANNYINVVAYSTSGTTAGFIFATVTVAGSANTRGSTAITLPTAGKPYWVRGRLEGNVLVMELFTTEPTPMATPATSSTYTLTAAETSALGATTRGLTGLYLYNVNTGTTTVDDFSVRALTYRNATFPRTFNLEGSWGGTTDALAAIHYTGSGGTAPVSMLYSWWPRVGAHNYVWNGGGELAGDSSSTAYGWVATAVSGVIAAASSVVRSTTAGEARTGSAYFTVVTPATTDTGASFIIHRRGGFKKGVTYTAQCYVKSSGGGTTAVRVKLGISGDLGTGTASALTTSYAIRTVTWTPSSDIDVAYFAVGVNAATATTFQFDDVQVFEGTTAPTFELGGHGPGIILANAHNSGKVADQAFFSGGIGIVDSTFLGGYRIRATGAMGATANLEYPLLPHLFTPDDYASDEVDVAIFARLEIGSGQGSLNCTLGVVPERGTGYGARRQGSFRSSGKTFTLASSGTPFRAHYLGTVTLRVDKTKPRREWLRLSFTNSGSATGTFGVDYLVAVPVRSCCRSRSGSTMAIVPDFITSTAETTKAIGLTSGGDIIGTPTGVIVDHSNGDALTPDDGLGGSPVRLHPDGVELLVWPSDYVVDMTDSSTSSMAKTFSGTLQVAVQPRVHLLSQ